MTSYAFVNGNIVTPRGILSAATIDVEGGVIVAIMERASAGAIDLDGGWLMPGFIDTQVNGGGGVLFNDQVDVATIAAIGVAQLPRGSRVEIDCILHLD